jgi:hypothetical protein
MTVSDDIETFDMGEFSLDTEDKSSVSMNKESFNIEPSIPPQGLLKKEIKKELKEIQKHSNRKSDDEIKEHQEHVLMLTRYGNSKRFADYLKSMSFNLGIT